jgi:hypothetical protein
MDATLNQASSQDTTESLPICPLCTDAPLTERAVENVAAWVLAARVSLQLSRLRVAWNELENAAYESHAQLSLEVAQVNNVVMLELCDKANTALAQLSHSASVAMACRPR